MPRSNIRSQSKDLITDDGAVLVSVVKGEQVRLNLTLGWLTNLTGFTLTAKVVEGNNVQGTGQVPTVIHPTTPQITTLSIIDDTVSDNQFQIVIPQDLCDNWDAQPLPDYPVYGFIGLEVKDTGTGSNQQIYKPFRGLVEVRYSPVEES